MSSMRVSVIAVVLMVCLQFLALHVVSDHRCHRDCRLPILRGDENCHKPCRRFAYNSSSGQCVSFSYTGCGGDENNFLSLDECNKCCANAPPCPKYTLPQPPENCRYKWFTDDDGCSKHKLICECSSDTCRPGICGDGQYCVPEPRECLRCPCPQYRCVSDPCEQFRISHHRPCKRCVVERKAHCGNDPCPLVPRYEDFCYAGDERSAERKACNICDQRGCHSTFYDRCHQNPCHQYKCNPYPQAKCYVDDCDCRKIYFVYEARRLNDVDCGFSYNQTSNYAINYAPVSISFDVNLGQGQQREIAEVQKPQDASYGRGPRPDEVKKLQDALRGYIFGKL